MKSTVAVNERLAWMGSKLTSSVVAYRVVSAHGQVRACPVVLQLYLLAAAFVLRYAVVSSSVSVSASEPL